MSYSFQFPYSIFMYQAPLKPGGQPHWYEVLRADDRHWAEYMAGLLHNAGTPASPETKPVLKVVRYGNTLLALPDAATVGRVEKAIEKYQAKEQHLPKQIRRHEQFEGE